MEALRKSLRTYGAQAMHKPADSEEEEKQSLLCHSDDCRVAQSSSSLDHTEEVTIKIDDGNVPDQKAETAPISGGGRLNSKLTGSSKKFKVSFEDVLNEAVQQRGKEFSRVSSFERNSWRLVMNKARSRLIDLPEEHYSDGAFSQDHDDHEDDDDDDVPEEFRNTRHGILTMLEWASLVLLTAAIVFSLFIPAIKRQTLWDIPLWKWEIMVLTLICGRLVSGWVIKIVVIFIEYNCLFRNRVLYFVYGLWRAVQNCLWMGLALLIWELVFDDKVEESKSKSLIYGTRILVCFFVGTVVWFLKTLLVKVLASSFHVNAFFDRIQEALFNQHVIETLSGPPLFERRSTEEEEGIQQQRSSGSISCCPGLETEMLQKATTIGKRSRISRTTSDKSEEEISVDKLQKLNQKNVSAWNMRRMINIVRRGGLSTLDEQILAADIIDDSSLHIRSEYQAKEAAKKIFHKVAKSGCKQIFLDDIIRFMHKEEASRAMHAIGEACENQGISKSSLNNWLVNAFRERKALALSLNDTKTAVDELHNLLNILVSIIILIIWLIILGIPISHFLVFISSQLLLVVFIFGNTCKTVFEAIVFLFIMHPYDVGDRCEVDGVQMRVEEMNILTTVFLRYDNQKIKYPNSVLASKPIGNFYRSPDMTETIEFCVHISTPMEKIAIMKDKMKEYVEGNSNHWHSSSMVLVTDVEDMNKIKMSMCLMHRMNFQEIGERYVRRALLLEEMIKVFKELGIEYRMLPLDVNVRDMSPLVSTRLPPSWNSSARVANQ